jgi:hypothetical protein
MTKPEPVPLRSPAAQKSLLKEVEVIKTTPGEMAL